MVGNRGRMINFPQPILGSHDAIVNAVQNASIPIVSTNLTQPGDINTSLGGSSLGSPTPSGTNSLGNSNSGGSTVAATTANGMISDITSNPILIFAIAVLFLLALKVISL